MTDRSRVLRKLQTYVAMALVTISLPFSSGHGFAAESGSGGGLEDYLKLLGYEAIAFERTDHAQDFIEGLIGEHRKLTLMVDTGWGRTTISKSAARGLKRTVESDSPEGNPLAKAGTPVERVTIDKLVLGHAELLNQRARVEDLRMDYIKVPFDGVLGCDFLFRNWCLIDCYKHRLYVHPAKLSQDQVSALEQTLRLSGFTEVAMDSHFAMAVEGSINGQKIRLVLDTGALCDVLDDSQLKALGLSTVKSDRAATGSWIPEDMNAVVLGVGTIGRHGLKATKVDAFQLGPRNWKNFYFGVCDLKSWNLSKPGTRGEGVKGLICQPTLARAGALIDVARQKVWFRPEKPAR